MLFPLSKLDNGTDRIATVSCFLFALAPSLDQKGRDALVDRIKEAAQRVVKKWRLLQGTPEWTKDGVWAIRVPDEDDEQHLKSSPLGFSTATHDQPYHLAAGLPAPLSPLSSAPSAVLSDIDLPLYRPSSLPCPLSGHVKHAFPLVHIHLSLFPDAIVVGISVPHAVLDGTGLGLLTRALTAELHSKEWEAPPLPEDGTNPLTCGLDRLEADEAVSAEAKEHPPPSLAAGAAPMSFLLVLVLALASFCEVYCWKSREGRVFLRDEDVGRLVKETKEEVKKETEGREYVSTGDVISAFLLKAFHSDESTTSDHASAVAVYSARSLLDAHSPSPPSLSLYPSNATFPYQSLLPLPLTTLSSTSLAALALIFRRNLLQHKILPSLQARSRETRTSRIPVPIRDWPQLPSFLSSLSSLFPWWKTPHTHRWVHSNQLGLGVADLSLPNPGEEGTDLPLLRYHFTSAFALPLDHLIMFQEVPGGVMVQVYARESRWKAMEKAVEKLRQGGRF
ncbi:hypothetical protein JCM8547_005980 [Rhodosporidiobolus lusitaniae]